MINKKKKIIVFGGKKIRRNWYDNEWYFSIVDVVEVLTDSETPRNYWKVLKHRLNKEGSEVVTFCNQLKLESLDGKKYLTDCANTKSIFRIIQSIPSKKAEPFKRWLAKVGYERVQEIENPELAQDRAKNYYEKKGYPKSWIDKRIRGIAIRQDLTDEWKDRGVNENKEFAILTNEIAKATFGVGIKEHKKIKSLNPKFKNQNLRDHMTDLELIFSMLGEASTTEITKNKDVLGFEDNKQVAIKGGEVAGKARIDLEKKSGRKVVSEKNYFASQKKLNKKKKIIAK
jgi:hypothetical protein